MKFQNPRFVTTVVDLDQLPKGDLPEIAVVGRSNVGKSTLLNHLFKTKHLVKTSATPGKTQALNFFSVDDAIHFVDLPGYGFAKEAISVDIEGYLSTRNSLKLLLFLLDSRRTPNEDDEKMLAWITHQQIPTIIVMTKIDKLNQKERVRQTRLITDRVKDLPHIHYSATKNVGRKELISMIQEVIRS